MNPPGRLIVFEGIDRSGKSSQSEKLYRALIRDGKRAIHLRFPDRTSPIGSMLNAYLQNRAQLDDRAVHLMFSANRWECNQKIVDALNDGIHVVIDRYIYSGVAYSAAKVKNPALDWYMAPDVGLPIPDITFYLQLSADVAATRNNYGEERYENVEFLRKVCKVYEQFKDMYIIDATKSMEEIHCEIYAVCVNKKEWFV